MVRPPYSFARNLPIISTSHSIPCIGYSQFESGLEHDPHKEEKQRKSQVFIRNNRIDFAVVSEK
jgi:hypothetical protein